MERKVYIASSIGIHHEQSEDSVLIGHEVLSDADKCKGEIVQRDLQDNNFVCVADGVGLTADGSAVSSFFLKH